MTERVETQGKFLELAGAPWRVRGVTYGTFVPRLDGLPFPDPDQIKRDLVAIKAVGLNTVRTYTLPPPEMLELAAELQLRLLVGLHYHNWHMEPVPGKDASRRILDAGRRAVRAAVERCAGRPELLALSVGNEVPADLVRLHGIGAVEDTLSALVEEVHAGDADMLATYSNFPTTEYLEVEGLDIVCFNVFLEDERSLRAYLRHLQVASEDKPLLLTEVGLASGIHGVEAQARSLEWQLRVGDEIGCAGATVFSWTDEWGVAGEPVEGWDFGITDVDRRPKPALHSVSRWASSRVRDLRPEWPRISVVVCAHNEQRTIADCLGSLLRCDYPGLEVIVCADGCTDATADIARSLLCNVIELPHVGLAAARNVGARASSGEIVAYLDADAECHPHWPYYLALSLEDPGVGATGGTNLPFEDAGLVERAVAASPGGPVEVLVSDDRAEHVPGCNMALYRAALEQVGGFDPVYRAAGDDVDIFWKLLDDGFEVGFSPAAQVRHHRRCTLAGYMRQQYGYGRAERLVARRHPHRFNRLGQARWRGVVYGGVYMLPGILRPVIYHGPRGAAPFQRAQHRPSGPLAAWAAALLAPVTAAGVAGALLAPLWSRSILVPACALAFVVAYATAVGVSVRPGRREPDRAALRALVALLHVVGPLARAWGRLRAPRSARARTNVPEWTGDRLRWLEALERELAARGCSIRAGGPYDDWDVAASVGPLVTARITTGIASGWEPGWRRRLRPRAGGVVAICAAAALIFAGVAPLLVALALACAGAIEVFRLARATGAALATSTSGARAPVRREERAA